MPCRATANKKAGREACYAHLMTYACGQGNDDALACMLASRMAGKDGLTTDWGLAYTEFVALMCFHFPGYDYTAFEPPNVTGDGIMRHDEQGELIDLMTKRRAGESPSARWMASIVAAGCLGSDHLWQDLGLWCRDDLSSLMQRNFPSLAEKNIHNMKWKKFLYKQLCMGEDVYVCRSPSCEVCVDYDECFGPET